MTPFHTEFCLWRKTLYSEIPLYVSKIILPSPLSKTDILPQKTPSSSFSYPYSQLHWNKEALIWKWPSQSPSFYRWETWTPEGFSNLPKAIQLLRRDPRLASTSSDNQTQVLYILQSCLSFSAQILLRFKSLREYQKELIACHCNTIFLFL